MTATTGVVPLRRRATALLLFASALGVVAFGWPLLASRSSAVDLAHSGDAPWVFVLLVPLLLCVLLGREPGRELAELLRTRNLQLSGSREDATPPVRAFGSAVTLPRYSPVEFPDTACIEVRRIHAHPLI